ncbi:MAG TPA: response regulator transcription factor [Ktedonobacteraceae bacterium]|nr:response regulator transcription factor [Ktedonobacteraceae bacterium]
MGQNVLIAESRELLRAGLQSVFASDPLVACVYEAATSEELRKHLVTYTPDLIVVHQSLITDILLLPRGHFVIMATEPDKNMLLAAFAYGARGYLLENTTAVLFHLALRLTRDMFLLDPRITPWLFQCISGDILPTESSEILTAREQEIFELLLSGTLTNRAIGEKLCISEATVKTHLAHIFRKLNIKRRPVRALALSVSDSNEQNQRIS